MDGDEGYPGAFRPPLITPLAKMARSGSNIVVMRRATAVNRAIMPINLDGDGCLTAAVIEYDQSHHVETDGQRIPTVTIGRGHALD